jgi:hypothetical protein
MKTNIFVKTVTLLLAVFVFLLPGCRNYMVPEEGALSLENGRIDFPEDGVREVVWKGKHLDVLYSISRKSDKLLLSGTVTIHDSVLMSFDTVEKLLVKFNFLDSSGRVLGTADITPLYTSYGQVGGPLNFKTATAFVPGTSSFAFSYFGVLFGRLDKQPDGWEIFYFPFE